MLLGRLEPSSFPLLCVPCISNLEGNRKKILVIEVFDISTVRVIKSMPNEETSVLWCQECNVDGSVELDTLWECQKMKYTVKFFCAREIERTVWVDFYKNLFPKNERFIAGESCPRIKWAQEKGKVLGPKNAIVFSLEPVAIGIQR